MASGPIFSKTSSTFDVAAAAVSQPLVLLPRLLENAVSHCPVDVPTHVAFMGLFFNLDDSDVFDGFEVWDSQVLDAESSFSGGFLGGRGASGRLFGACPRAQAFSTFVEHRSV